MAVWAVTGGAVDTVRDESSLGITGARSRIGRSLSVPQRIWLGPAASHSADNDMDLIVGQHAAGVLRKRRHRRSRNSVGRHAPDRGVVGDSEINWIAKSNRRAALSIRAMASGTVPRVEKIEVHNPVRWDHSRFHWRTSLGTASSAGRQSCQRYRQKNCGLLHGLVHSSLIPDPSTPARKASGKCCHVRIRSCLETTMPATIPNATCDATNQPQWIRSLSTGFTIPRML